VNYLTTNLLQGSSFNTGTDLARGVASGSVGAPVGNVGDWIVKGAFNAGGLSSWALHGEYRSRENQTHVLTLGMSHSAQVVTDRSGTLTGPVQSRSVGDIYGYDRWHASRLLELDYGLRFDRYDYLTTGPLVSPRAGVRLQVAPGTYAVVSGSYDRVAPGAGEFLPPAATGPWLPPQRTFSSLGGARSQPSRSRPIKSDSISSSAPPIACRRPVRRFRQSIDDQVATLFGVEVEGDVDHYLVATAGDVQIDGWSVGIGGALSPTCGARSTTRSARRRGRTSPRRRLRSPGLRQLRRDRPGDIELCHHGHHRIVPVHRHRGVVRLPHELGLQSDRSREPSSRV
jgi:hypothetical protein